MSERSFQLSTEQQAGIWNQVIGGNDYFWTHGVPIGWTDLSIPEQQTPAGCADVGFDLKVTKSKAVNTNTWAIQVKTTWEGNQPDHSDVDFFGQGTRQDRKDDTNPIPPDPGWEVDRKSESYDLTITGSLQAPNGEVCTDSETVTIDALQEPTLEPTPVPATATTAPSATPTTAPTPVPATAVPTITSVPPTEAPTVTACISTDVKGQFVFLGDPRSHQISDPTRFRGSNIAQNAACKDDTYIQVFQAPSDVRPNSDGRMPLDGQKLIDRQRIDIPQGANNQEFTRDLPNSVGPEELWCQVDLTRDPISEARQAVGDVMIDYGFYKCVTKEEKPTATRTTAPSATSRPTTAPSPTPTRTATPTHTVRPTPVPNNEPDDTATPVPSATNTETSIPASATRTPNPTNTPIPAITAATPTRTETATPVTPLIPLPVTGAKGVEYKDERGKVQSIASKSTNKTLIHLDPYTEGTLGIAAALCLVAGGIGAYARHIARRNP